MAIVPLVDEDDATGRVREVYDDIKSRFGIDFVPNMYKAMATDPDNLVANWDRVKTVMIAHGSLNQLTKEIVALTVSVVNRCDY